MFLSLQDWAGASTFLAEAGSFAPFVPLQTDWDKVVVASSSQLFLVSACSFTCCLRIPPCRLFSMDALSVVAAARGRTCSMRRVCLTHLLACTPFPKHTLYGSCCRCRFLHMHPCCNIRLSHSIPILTSCSLNVLLVFHPRKSYSDSCVFALNANLFSKLFAGKPPQTNTHTHIPGSSCRCLRFRIASPTVMTWTRPLCFRVRTCWTTCDRKLLSGKILAVAFVIHVHQRVWASMVVRRCHGPLSDSFVLWPAGFSLRPPFPFVAVTYVHLSFPFFLDSSLLSWQDALVLDELCAWIAADHAEAISDCTLAAFLHTRTPTSCLPKFVWCRQNPYKFRV